MGRNWSALAIALKRERVRRFPERTKQKGTKRGGKKNKAHLQSVAFSREFITRVPFRNNITNVSRARGPFESMEKWLFYERSHTNARFHKIAPPSTPAGYEKNIFSRFSAGETTPLDAYGCQREHECAAGIWVFNDATRRIHWARDKFWGGNGSSLIKREEWCMRRTRRWFGGQQDFDKNLPELIEVLINSNSASNWNSNWMNCTYVLSVHFLYSST